MNKAQIQNLRKWLRPPEAASYLGTKGSMDTADVLRLALDGHLPMCVHIPKAVRANLQETIEGPHTGKFVEVEGLWDLPMVGVGRLYVEHLFNSLNHLPYIAFDGRTGASVSQDGVVCRLPGFSGDHGQSPAAFPLGCLLVLRVESLRKLADEFPESDGMPEIARIDRPLSAKERTNLLVIIAGLCKAAGIDYKKSSKAGEAIEGAIRLLGASMTARAIADHLNRIPDALERRSQDSAD